MKKFLHWLALKLSGTRSIEALERHSSDLKELETSKNDHLDDSASNGSKDSRDDNLMPDIYGDSKFDTLTDDDTQPDLEIIEDPSKTSEMSEGFDPYNSGDFKIPKK